MRPRTYVVSLTEEQRTHLQHLIAVGHSSASTLAHARLLLKADSRQESGAWSDEAIAEALEVGFSTVQRVRKRFAQQGLECALSRKKQACHRRRALDGEAQAPLIALTCSVPPEGLKRWTLRLLASGMVEAGYVGAISHEAVRQTLKKTNLSLG